jgi:hypothetical protein
MHRVATRRKSPAERLREAQSFARTLCERAIEKAGHGDLDALLAYVIPRIEAERALQALCLGLKSAAPYLYQVDVTRTLHGLRELGKLIDPQAIQRAERYAKWGITKTVASAEIARLLDRPAEEIDPDPHIAWWVGRRPKPVELAWIDVLAITECPVAAMSTDEDLDADRILVVVGTNMRKQLQRARGREKPRSAAKKRKVRRRVTRD